MQSRHDTYAIVEAVAVPVPCFEELDSVAVAPGPSIAVCKRRVQSESDDSESKEDHDAGLTNHWTLTESKSLDPSREKVIDLAKGNDGKVKSREVVVEEELSLHQKEGEVVEEPSENRSANLVVEALECDIVVVSAAPLPAKDSDGLEGKIKTNGCSRAPPDQGVANEVDLSVVLAPEVDTTAEDRP